MKENPDDRYPRMQFRLSEGLERNLQDRSDHMNSIHVIGKRDLERLYSVMPRMLPQLSEAEACVLLNVIGNSKQMDVKQFMKNIRLLPTEVRDVLGECPVKGVDSRMFVKRLKALSPFEVWAIFDAIERFWHGSYHVENTSERLREVGLVK